MNSGGEFDEVPLTVHKRSCDMRNVCWVDGRLTYYMDPEEAVLVDRVDRIDGFGRDDFVVLSKRDVALNVHVVHGPVPDGVAWLDADVAVYLAHSWSENFGTAVNGVKQMSHAQLATKPSTAPDRQ